MIRLRLNVGPKSIFFFAVFCCVLFLSINWKLSYVVTKDYVEKTQRERAAKFQLGPEDSDSSSKEFDQRHRRLDP